jgi:hypothetical protein
LHSIGRFVRARADFLGHINSLLLLLHEVTNELRNLIRSDVEREMASIEDVDFGFRHIFTVTSTKAICDTCLTSPPRR